MGGGGSSRRRKGRAWPANNWLAAPFTGEDEIIPPAISESCSSLLAPWSFFISPWHIGQSLDIVPLDALILPYNAIFMFMPLVSVICLPRSSHVESVLFS